MLALRLHLIAHDIRSRENVGAIFRTGEFLGVEKLWLTGYTPAPPDAKILKVALGAEKNLFWEKKDDARELINRLKQKDFRIVGLEIAAQAADLAEYRAEGEIALVLGNEVAGISPSLLEMCDDVVAIGRRGNKESLNVAVAAGIAVWKILCSDYQS